MKEVVERQRQYFFTHETKSIEFRKRQLRTLREAILKYEDELYKALSQDFKKSQFETYVMEIGLALDEIRHDLKHLDHWAKPEKVKTPITQYKSSSRIYKEPYGVCLVMSPWNYPFLLTISPVIGSMAAGNCNIIKTSRYAPETSHVIKRMIEEFFPPEYLTVIEGGREVNQALLAERFDYIFFTGSPFVGKIVMEAAAKNLTPITLELGGKSPCIVDQSADLKISAKRIVWGKFANAGQTCVAPDYIVVHESIKEELIKEIKLVIKRYYGDDIKLSNDFPRIINEKHAVRLSKLINQDKVVFGGQFDLSENYIEPTIMDNVTWEDDVMKEEIFGPLMPIMTFKNMDDVVVMLNGKPKPLALYIFSKDNKSIKSVLKKVSYGGGCVNDTLVHLANINMPFGGVGNSGMGGYHGKFSFDTFSHHKSVLSKSLAIDMPLRYAPYTDKALRTIKKLMK